MLTLSYPVADILVQFLENGADPNTLLYEPCGSHPPFSVAWVELLLLPFIMNPDRASCDAYLEILAALFRCGFDIDAQTEIQFRWSLLTPPTTITAYHLFFRYLEKLALYQSSKYITRLNDLRRRRARTAIQMLLIKTYSHERSMDETWRVVAEVFGEKEQLAMQAHVKASRGGDTMDSSQIMGSGIGRYSVYLKS